MGILRDMPIRLSLPRVVAALSRCAETRFSEQDVAQAISVARTLIRPAVVFAWGQVTMPQADKIELQWQNRKGVTVLHPGPHTDLLAAAETALVGVSTIGRQIDAHIQRLQQAGDTLPAYLLDCVGVMALIEAGQALRRLAEKRAAERAWGVGPLVGPGSLAGWDLAEQADLCAGLDLGAIGVSLNASYVLVPYKSTSALIGLGPDYASHKVGSVCRLCPRAASCWLAELSDDSIGR